MFSKLALFAAASMAVFVAAVPSPGGGTVNSCNGGTVQCCNQLQTAGSKATPAKTLLSVLIPASVTAGLDCSPIDILSFLGGQSCSAQTVCCTGNNFSGLVVIGCTPINANL